MSDEKYWLGLKLIPEANRFINRLYQQFKSPRAIWEASLSELQIAVGVNSAVSQKIVEKRATLDLDAELERIRSCGIRLLTIDSEKYPYLLKQIFDPPPVLFIKGQELSKFIRCVAIVGSRRCSTYGKMIAEKLAYSLSCLGVTVVSGVARGIDSASHKGALKGTGLTIGVIGSGLDIIYPSENSKLYQEISSKGALLSEQPLGTRPYKANFPSRNRIISGLSLGVIIVEAGARSGALITADFALEQGREVMAVPGDARSGFNRGSHKLLKQGAVLIENAEDVIEALGLEAKLEGTTLPCEELTDGEKILLDALGWEVKCIDEIAQIAKLGISQTSSLLTLLELKGYVKQDVGKRYLRVN